MNVQSADCATVAAVQEGSQILFCYTNALTPDSLDHESSFAVPATYGHFVYLEKCGDFTHGHVPINFRLTLTHTVI